MSRDRTDEVADRRALIEQGLSGDPTDADPATRAAFYQDRAEENLRAACLADDPDGRGLAEDTAMEAMYRAKSLRRNGRFRTS